MTSVPDLVASAESLGATFEVTGDAVTVEAPVPLPDDLLAELRLRKPQVIQHIHQQAERDHERPDRRYRWRYSGLGPDEGELADIGRRVQATGACLTWCEALGDFVAFVRDDIDRDTLPPGFVVYAEAELPHLSGLSVEGLRRIHAAKKTGAVITGVEPDTGA